MSTCSLGLILNNSIFPDQKKNGYRQHSPKWELWKGQRQGRPNRYFRQLFCGHMWWQEEAAQRVSPRVTEGWPRAQLTKPNTSPARGATSWSSKPRWPAPDVQQCSSATYTPANGTTKSSVLVKMLFSAGCKSINLRFHPYCTDATLNKGKTNAFLNTAFRFTEVPSFPHRNSAQHRYFSVCSSPSFMGKFSFGHGYKRSAQLATAANGLLMTTRVGSAIPGWEVCSTGHLSSSTQPFAAFNMRSDAITLDFCPEGILFLLALPELRLRRVHDTARC